MIRKIFLSLVLFLLSNKLCSSPSISTDLSFCFNFINSSGLNKITEGLDAGYGTSFGRIKFPMSLLGSFSLGFNRAKIGIEFGYEFANSNSYSSTYNITENLSYSAFPIGVRYSYMLVGKEKWSLWSRVSTGIMLTNFSMNTQPSVSALSSSYSSEAIAWYFSPAFDCIYLATKNIGFITTLSARYANTSNFSYNTLDGRHNRGDYVVFSDGSNLTMNVSGLKFSLGIILSWS
ncbi:MAG: hypothetical protein WCQ47_03510 [bacterium]